LTFYEWIKDGLLEDAENGLSLHFRHLLAHRYEQLIETDGHIDFFTYELEVQSKQDDACQRLQEIPGYGRVLSTVLLAMVVLTNVGVTLRLQSD
jgi:transposase